MKARSILALAVLPLVAACGGVDLEAPIAEFETGVSPDAWALVPAGEFLSGQQNHPVALDYDYEIMVTDVTVAQYIAFLNEATAQGRLRIEGSGVVGAYPGDAFHAAKHEVEIPPADYLYVPLDDPASRFTFDGGVFSVKPGYESHPMTNVSWFGAWGYCGDAGGRLPGELEWEKAARGSEDDRPFPWGEDIARNLANFYSSRDPFEDMGSFGSRTSPVGFYNGRTYDGYVTLDAASPYGLYDMAGNVWQWTGDVYEGQHYRYMRGGSKDSFEVDVRIWVRNNATPTYYSPGVGFRCVREP
ncbi:MAG TPA: formylglycine-generating enzyme family protein [Anaerolineales bacterium]|nr:formylglycine-generating enzyme family protein [Anaerolineales bacterium]